MQQIERPFENIVELLKQRAIENPNKFIYRFLANGENETDALTYLQLYQKASAIAAWLNVQGIRAGERVLINSDPDINYIVTLFGCIFAGVIAVPLCPAKNKVSLQRIIPIMQNAQPIAMFCNSITFRAMQIFMQEFQPLQKMRFLVIEEAMTQSTTYFQGLYGAKPEQIAWLQYTSGSTGIPKGVPVSHANVLANVSSMSGMLGFDASTIGITWLPPYHDAGLVGFIMQTLFSGGQTVLMPPTAFFYKPYRWLAAFSNYRGHATVAPDFAYALCVKNITAEQKKTLDLSSWKIAANGSEPIQMETMEAFVDYFADCGVKQNLFVPVYGMAETTLCVTIADRSTKPNFICIDRRALSGNKIQICSSDQPYSEKLVSCGPAIPLHDIKIVDPITNIICAPDKPGEIYVSGESVTAGYWQNLKPHGLKENLKYYFRTNDIGFLYQNQLYVLGRLADRIVMDDGIYYPNLLENIIRLVDVNIVGCAIFAAVRRGKTQLFIALESIKILELMLQVQLTAMVVESLKEHYFISITSEQVIWVKPGGLPRTTSGKLQRHKCIVLANS